MTIAAEFEFTLPRGLVDAGGGVHRQGRMRLATAKDEIAVEKDRRSQDSEAYSTLILLARVITCLGDLSPITPEVLENLFTQDLGYLREFYNRINKKGEAAIPTRCPVCNADFKVELRFVGES